MKYIEKWAPIPNTEERVLRNTETGQVIEFSDDPADTSQELPIIGLADYFDPSDLARLRRKYSDYELASGGA